MKKLLVILFLSFFTFSLSAQITGGGTQTSTPKQAKPASGVFKNYTNLQFYANRPLGQFGDIIENATPGYFPLNVGLGVGGNLGQTFFLNSLNISPNARLAIEATYLNVVYQLPKTYVTAMNQITSSSGTISAGLGLSFNFNPKDNLIVGAKFNVLPTLFNYERSFAIDDDSPSTDYIGWATMLRSSIGVFARNDPFYVGFELSFGKKDNMIIKDKSDNQMSFLAETSRLDIVVGFSF